MEKEKEREIPKPKKVWNNMLTQNLGYKEDGWNKKYEIEEGSQGKELKYFFFV